MKYIFTVTTSTIIFTSIGYIIAITGAGDSADKMILMTLGSTVGFLLGLCAGKKPEN